MQFRWDEFVLDVPSRRLTGPTGEVHVEPQVFDLLCVLIAERDRIVPKEELLDTVWGDQFVSESALTTRIKEARRAVGDDGRTQRYIRNAHGVGYQFVGSAIAEEPMTSSVGRSTREPDPLTLALDITVDDEFPFVGRAPELAAAETFLSRSEVGASELLIGGAPGAGKSRLAIEVLERAAGQGRLVCAGRCEENVRSALQPVRDAFTQLASVAPGRVASWCAGVEGPLLSLIPSLVDHLSHDPVPVDAYAGIDVFTAVFDRVVAETPLLILVDDLQWSDEPTRGFLDRLHRRLSSRPITTVYTFRSGRRDLPANVDQWLRRRPRDTTAQRLDLGDLEQAAARDLAATVLGVGADDAAEVVEATSGNCLFLTESLRDLQAGQTTSGSVAELMAARVSRQPADVQSLVQAGALLGNEFSFSVAALAAELEPSEALAAMDTAVDAELLHETTSPARFRFSHQLVRQSIAGSMTRQMRALVHSSCATALQSEESADDIEVSIHLLGAVPLVSIDEGVEKGRSAARLAVDQNQFDRAIRVLELVLDAEIQTRTRAEVLLEIGWAVVSRGVPGEAVPHFEEVADLARRNGWLDLLANAALGHWGRSPFRRLSDTSTLELLHEADAALAPTPSLLKARVQAKIAAFSLFTTRLSERSEMVDAALAMAPGATGTDRMELLESRSVVFSCPAGVDQLDLIDPELADLRRASSHYFADAAAPESRLLMRGLGAEFREAAALDVERTRVQPISEWRDAVLRSTLATFTGDFDNARRLCDIGGATGEPFWGESSYALHALGHLFIDCVSGDWGRSVEHFEIVAAARAQVVLPPHAWALFAAGEQDRAVEVIGQLRPANLVWFGEHIIGGNALVAYGELALLMGNERMAKAAERWLEPFQHLVLGTPWAASLAAADTLSRLAARRGDEHTAEQYRSRAHDLYTMLDAPALLARISRS